MIEGVNPAARWRRQAWPFAHLLCEEVFEPGVYKQLVAALHAAISAAEAGSGFQRTLHYEADILTLKPEDAATLPVLLERGWHDLLAQLTGIEHSGEIDAGIHRHKPGSTTGWVHHDFAPGYFHAAAASGVPLIADRARCDYSTGKRHAADVVPVERVRAAAMIYFLDNRWEPGCGGETGLYRHQRQSPHRPDARVAPRNNTLLLFECTPHSYHSFLTNTHYPRHSIILWLHRPPEMVRAKWGANVCRW